MKASGIAGVVVVAIGLAYALWPTPAPVPNGAEGDTAQGGPLADVTLPDTLSEEAVLGQRAFEAKCAACHGNNAAGQDGIAPPLVHVIYEPGHHGDESFQMAAAQGVRAHHWPFGNMPPVEGVTRADIATIITYIRELQRANGIN